MKINAPLSILVILFQIAISAYGQKMYIPQQADPLSDAWRIRQVDELRTKSVMCIDEGINGSILFGHQNSIIKYDGYNWQEFNYTAQMMGAGFPIRTIETENELYLVKRLGIFVYKDTTWTEIVRRDNDLKFYGCYAIKQPNGNILLGTNKFLLLINGQKKYCYAAIGDIAAIRKKLPGFKILPVPFETTNGFGAHAFCNTDSNKVAIMGAGYGLVYATATADTATPLTFEKTDIMLPVNDLSSLFRDNSGNLWLSSEMPGNDSPIFCITNNGIEEYNPRKNFGVTNKTSRLVQCNDGTILVGGQGNLFAIRDKKTIRYTRPQLPLTEQTIKVYKDKYGNVWMASFGGKTYLIEYHDTRFKKYPILVFQFASNGTKWFISKDSKIVLLKNDEWYAFDQTDGLMDAPLTLIQKTNGDIWCAGSHQGKAATAYYKNRRWYMQTHPYLAWSVAKKGVYEDENGALYFGSPINPMAKGGVLKLNYNDIDNLIWEHISDTTPPELNQGMKFTDIYGGIYSNNLGKLRFLSFAWLWEYHKGVFNQLKVGGFGPATSFVKLKNNEVFIGGIQSGAMHFADTDNMQLINSYSVANGLLTNSVLSMATFDSNTVWVATDEDISYFDGKNWVNNCFPAEFNISGTSGELRADKKSGDLYINHVQKEWELRASNNNTVDFGSFGAIRYKADTNGPLVFVSNYDDVVDQSGNTYISWYGVDYWNLTPSSELEFSYRLNNGEWSPYLKEKGHNFQELHRGKYTLWVKARDKEFNVSEKPVTIFFKVLPPVYLRVWFLIMVSVFTLVTLYLIRNIIVRNKKLQQNNYALQEQKEEILAQNEEIQQQAEELTTQKDALAEQNEEIKTKNEQISEAYTRIEMISEFGQKLTSALSIESINNMLFNYVSNIIDIHAFGIGIYNEDKKQIVFPKFYKKGKEPTLVTKNVSETTGLTAWCFNQQKPVFINDISLQNIDYLPKARIPSGKDIAQSRIHLPLTVNEKPIGIFIVNSFEANAYSKDDYNNLKTLAAYISIALDNAKAYEQINDKNKAIKESITYAQSIQNAFMPTQEQLNRYMDCFVLFKPKDIVSGDFTWFSPIQKDPEKPLKAFVCVADCTGHGVPGALVSMVGNNLLHENINLRGQHNPAQVLEMVNVGFQLALKQDETRNNDGMDMALILLEALKAQSSKMKEGSSFELSASSFQLTFSGAKNPCVIYRAQTGELEVLKGSRKSIGGLRAKRSKQYYEKHETIVNKGDCIYLFSDGIIDQHNASRDRFSREKLLLLLKNIGNLNSGEQKQIIEKSITEFMHNEKQTDDISLIGIRF